MKCFGNLKKPSTFALAIERETTPNESNKVKAKA